MTALPASADVAPVQQRADGAVTADALPTVQINGVVWDQVIVGNTVYVAGEFTSARPAGAAVGTNETPRSNLLAYNLTTGDLITSFTWATDKQVKSLAVSPDQKTLYFAGQFSKVYATPGAATSVNRYRIGAINLTNNTLTNFAPQPNATVNGIAVTSDAVYAGGIFTAVGSVSRTRLAAFNPTSGAVLGWAPTADATVQAVLPTPDKSRVLVAGAFANINGSTATGLGSINATDGSLLPWTANTVIRNYGSTASMLKLRTDGTTVYAVGYWYGGTGTFEGVLAADPNSGDIKWLADCHGDTYDVTPMNDYVYAVSHWHYCSNIGGFPDTNPRKAWYHANAVTKEAMGTVQANGQGGYVNFAGYAAPAMVNWFPALDTGTYTGTSQAAWSATSNSQYLVLGGEFPSVNGVAQYGLVRFAVPSLAPNKQGPQVAGAPLNPSLQALGPDKLRIRWQADFDRDDQNLTYTLTRSGTPSPVFATTQASQFWNRPAMSFTDTGLVAGQTYKYRLAVSDPSGNTVQSETVQITMPSSVDPYVAAVLTDGAQNYWRLDGTGTTQTDYAGGLDQTSKSGATSSTDSALSSANNSLSFNGTSNGFASTSQAQDGLNTFSAEAWFKTSSTTGGKILGFGNSTTGNSSSYDRHVYMDNAGRILFGVYPGSVQTVQSATGYNDGKWHHVVAELSSAGMALYLDGKKVSANSAVTSAQAYSGYWRIGGDNINGWTNQPSSFYFKGAIDEVAIYPTALSGAQVRSHYTESGRTLSIPAAPTDSYGKAVYADNPTLYWRLNESSGTTASDVSPNQVDGTYAGGVTQHTASPVSDPAFAATFGGTNGVVGSNQQFTNPSNYSEEVWFNTTTQVGGKLMGFGDKQSGNSSNYDRHVYLDAAGHLNFGVWTGSANVITSPNTYNDGKWHQVVATQSSTSGMSLYVDGVLAGTNSQTQAQAYTGYWRIGGDVSWSGANYFNGQLDEAAVYDSVLTAAQVKDHYDASPAAVNVPPVAAFTSSCDNGACTFDSSTAADPDGSIASYAWDFGDDKSSTDANPSHTYSATGTYQVSLTVTDNKGATNKVTKSVDVTVTHTNASPTAAFTQSCTELACDFDGSGSSDSDGTVASYAWDFGDSKSSTDATPSHTFDAAGTYSVKLTVTDNDGATDSVTKDVTVAAHVNAKPVADFTQTCTDLDCSFDASASSDSDGTIASYAWDFGDSSAAGSGKSPTHSYSAAGTYSVKLTVIDNDGATDSKTASVTVTAAAAGPIAADTFSRTTTRWGSAETGGAWTYSGSTFSTNGDTGDIKLASAGVSSTASLNSVSAQDVDVTADFSVDKAATGSGTYNYLLVRKVGNSDYRAAFQEQAGGKVKLSIIKTVSGTATTLKQVALTDLTYSAGDKMRLRFVASGNGTTDLTLKAWKVGSTEPTNPQVSTSDNTSSLQAPGSFAVISYLGGTVTNAPVTVSVDNLLITAP